MCFVGYEKSSTGSCVRSYRFVCVCSRSNEKDAHGGTEREFKEVCDGRELEEFSETNII